MGKVVKKKKEKVKHKMEEKKKCPFMNGLDCMELECACFDETYTECTVFTIGNSLANLFSMLDNKKVSVGVFNDD